MRKFSYKIIEISDLYVNPENYRYVEDVKDEINAIIEMFNVNVGDPKKEMITLANDIIEDGLNPFEMPIVCYDDVIKKYVVYDGNRRITCIKLMTQYKNNPVIQEAIPTVAEIYKMDYTSETSVQCVVYEEADDAIHFLNKIHNDVNNGIGRKQWDSQAKMRANAAYGNKTKSYAIVEFIKNNPKTDEKLIKMINENRWISKLERVVSFALFRDVYNIQFDNNSNMSYLDTEEQVLKMMSKLVYDVITNSATDNFRFKADFEKYVQNLPDEFKTQVKNNFLQNAQQNNNGSTLPINENKEEQGNKSNTEKKDETKKDIENETGSGKPKNIPYEHAKTKAALVLCKNYDYSAYECLNEKGKEMLIELESLNIKQYPVATAALCRCLLEYTIKLWMDEQGGTFNSQVLPTTYNGCVNLLRQNKIIDNKEHSVLSASVNKEDYITLLNTWMHADTEACVAEVSLVSGWKNVRLLVEKYIERHKK